MRLRGLRSDLIQVSSSSLAYWEIVLRLKGISPEKDGRPPRDNCSCALCEGAVKAKGFFGDDNEIQRCQGYKEARKKAFQITVKGQC